MSEDKKYPCAKCGVLRTKEEGGEIFTVCDKCWDSESLISMAASFKGVKDE